MGWETRVHFLTGFGKINQQSGDSWGANPGVARSGEMAARELLDQHERRRVPKFGLKDAVACRDEPL